MSTLPVYNVSVPHLAQIPGGLQPGSMIRVKGTLTSGSDRFVINLQAGAAISPCADINLHLSVRPTENAIVRNHLQASTWGTEERYGNCPIHVGAPFEIIVLAQHSAFKVAINGAHFCEFNHRLPLHGARFVSVSGSVHVQSILLEHENGSVPPVQPPPPYTPAGYPTQPHIAVCPPAPPHHMGPHYPPPPGGFIAYPGVGSGAAYSGVASNIQAYPGGPPHMHRPITPHHPHQHPNPHYPIIAPFQAPPSHPTPPPPPHYGEIGPNPFDPIQQHQRAFAEAAAAKRQKRQKALQYAAGGVGVGLSALALGSVLSGIGGDSDSD